MEFRPGNCWFLSSLFSHLHLRIKSFNLLFFFSLPVLIMLLLRPCKLFLVELSVLKPGSCSELAQMNLKVDLLAASFKVVSSGSTLTLRCWLNSHYYDIDQILSLSASFGVLKDFSKEAIEANKKCQWSQNGSLPSWRHLAITSAEAGPDTLSEHSAS